ncbi:chemotaxis protein CheY [Alkalihalobacillus alcalophilus ATCC 27647 = CGMCC 1.3604]|uniref:Protein-glutamate methylesterase/protein-glutamine glutaminase n=1 Tax=Alkalihalobacillus alcalophilus ATCC 27647 = CGMCC 1.3604 TaxID=1218173 RepID=A0A094XHK7_ALKAL|nr:chemotaxis response regulator protein-glutamate methylesterase [Alkalihalobacillus alcalophilus]KGA98230.1 chemotaxis protein CheY [Alkalihalobacillus alcalophilus ATCC 27647 = CGMCC 1.3604]MED1562170.1 chemotaxis response regulator protein-glutamate methylesterase [Alkalihalobacillus alcalophilus]THG91395.1 chemotaxis protein CheY [Alkalihalobacillus alcalophilus ATCC 27647 = CGMCC 1.3604]
MNRKINVLVVDDSAFMRRLISEMLNTDPQINVIGTARNGHEALSKREQLKPDVMTLDVEMPVMNGLETLKQIMRTNPCPIIMLSSTTSEGAENTLLAVEYGAVDFVAKTSGPISLDLKKIEAELREKVKCAAKVRNLRAPAIDVPKVRPKQVTYSLGSELVKKLVLIGTSTGGPKALKQVLPALPKDYPYPILVVQHMPAGFTKSLANRLNSLSEIEVKEAEPGEKLQGGVAYIAPGDSHLEVKRINGELCAHLTKEDPIRGLRPAVDCLFHSVAKIDELQVLAIILTGMGADGTDGLYGLKKRHSVYALAESEKTCVVFGMPKVAIKSKLIDKVIDLECMSDEIIHFVRRKGV